MELAGKKVLVVGAGRSGAAAARLCLAKGAVVTVTDSAPAPPLAAELASAGVKLSLGGHRTKDFAAAEILVLSPGVDPRRPEVEAARAQGAEIIGELELGLRFCASPSLMITGTNGKSTVTSLAGEMLRADGKKVFVGGNLGSPLCEHVLSEEPADWVVLEVSSFQIDTAPSLHPKVGAILNIAPDHTDRYADFTAYAASKLSLLHNQVPGDVAILCADDPALMARRGQAPIAPWFYGAAGPHEPGGWLESDQAILAAPGREPVRLSLEHCRLAGGFNRLNVLAAALSALACGAGSSALQSAIDSFEGLPHRVQLVANLDGADFYDDSKGTNLDAVRAAVLSFGRPLILLLGGRAKSGPFAELRPFLLDRVKGVICFGEAGPEIHQTLADLLPSQVAADLPAAFQAARALAEPGDAVLLSPGCASFDAYENYAQRGDHFQSMVREAAGE